MNNQKDKQHPTQNLMPPTYRYNTSQDDEINLVDLWKALIDKKTIIFLITTLTTLAALIYALWATPIYRAEALLAPVTKEKGGRLGALAGQFGGLASLAGIDLGGGGDGIEEALATLRSRELTYNFIKDEELIQVIFKDKWDHKNKKWINETDVPTLWNAYEIFNNSIRFISVDQKTGLITLAIEWNNPVQAADWANKLVYRVNNKLRQESILEAEKSIKYLETELQNTSIIEIKESIYSLIEAQTKNKMLANTQAEYAFHVLDPAVVPERVIKPKRNLIIISGMLFGLLISMLTVLLLNFIRSNNS